MKKHTKINQLNAALLALAIGTVNALATDGTWTQAGKNTFDWETTGNWSGSNIADGAGSTGTFQVAPSGNQVIRLNGNSRTLGTMLLQTNGRSQSIAANASETLTFDNTGGTNGPTAQLTVGTTSGNNSYFYLPILLNTSLNISNVCVNGRTLNFGTSGGHFATITNNSSNALTITNNGSAGNSGVSLGYAVSDGTNGGTLSVVQSSANSALILGGTNTYTGATTINAGTLSLGAAGSINNTPQISIAAGGTLDVSAIASYTLSGSTTLAASGTGTGATTQATIKGGATGGNVSLGSQGITLTWGGATSGTDSAHPCLVVSQGALTLSNNAITINGGSLLGDGTYTLISVTGGTISGTPSASVTGSAIDPSKTNVVSVSGGTVILTVSSGGSTPTITAPATLPGNLATTHGTASPAQIVLVSGANLGANITTTAQTGFEVSSDNLTYGSTATFTESGGSVTDRMLYVRLAATASAAGSYNGVTAAILSSIGATPVNVATTAIGNTVSKGNQTITFTMGTAVAKGLGGAPFADTATANSGLTVTYSSDNTDVATVDESGTVTIIATGTAHILANQAGDENWNAAPQASQTLTVALISNGGFETNTGSNGGSAADWIKDGAYGIESGYGGGWAFNSGGTTTSGFYQTLGAPLVAGLKYQLSYYLATWAAGNQMNVRVGKYVSGSRDSDDSYSPLPLSAIDTNPTGAWKQFTHTFTALGGEDSVYFGATAIQPGDPGGKYDNVVLSIVPFTLGYDANGGTGTAPGPYSQSYGTTIATAPADTFTRTGFTFAAWNTAADGSGTAYAAGDPFTFTADTTLYARWTSDANYDSWAAAQSPPLIGGAGAVGADGLTNLIIYAIDGLKTDHTNGSAGILNPVTLQLSFTKRPEAITNGDVSWSIETSPDLEHWTTQVSQPKGDPTSTISYTLPAGAGMLFARLVVNQ